MNSQLHILGMTRFKMDNGQEFATVFVLEDDPMPDANKLGSIAIECKSDYDLIDRCKEMTFPGDYVAKIQMVAGSKKKSTLYIHDLQPLADTVKAAVASTAKTPAKKP